MLTDGFFLWYDDHSYPDSQAVLGGAVLTMLIYGLGAPAFVIWRLWQHRRTLTRDTQLWRVYGFLYDGM